MQSGPRKPLPGSAPARGEGLLRLFSVHFPASERSDRGRKGFVLRRPSAAETPREDGGEAAGGGESRVQTPGRLGLLSEGVHSDSGQ